MRIGARGSKLALWQAKYTQQQLNAVGVESELVILQSAGELMQPGFVRQTEGKAHFVKSTGEALLRGDIDLAVHSLKDLPTEMPSGLVITAVSHRADPADWLVIRRESREQAMLLQLKEQAVVGASNARRKAQLQDFRPDLRVRDVSGNMATKLGRLAQGDFDAVVLAAAGLTALEIDLTEFHILPFNPREFVPAPGQGVMAFQTCADDLVVRRLIKQIHHPEASAATNVERATLRLLGHDHRAQLGVYCERDGQGNYHVWAALADEGSGTVKRAHLSSSTSFQLPEKIVAALKR